MKKHKKDYKDFINKGNSPEAYDITRKKFTNVTAMLTTNCRKGAGACRHEPLKFNEGHGRELEVSATLVRKIVKEDL